VTTITNLIFDSPSFFGRRLIDALPGGTSTRSTLTKMARAFLIMYPKSKLHRF
jgi:hypothetical protein